MEFKLFKESLIHVLEQKLAGAISVQSTSVRKNNGVMLEGIIMNREGEPVSPTIYLEELYEQYEKEELTMEDAADFLIHLYEKSMKGAPKNVEEFSELSFVESKIVYRLVQYEKNREWLKGVPHIPYLDMAIVFYCLFEKNCGGFTSITIQNQHMKLWELTVEQLYALARKNTPSVLKVRMENMISMLTELSMVPGVDDDKDVYPEELKIYILTNTDKIYGAAAILYPGCLEQIGKKLESDFYLLPSSVHEMILIPGEDESEKEKYQSMVTEINHTQLPEEEILTDSVYYYRRKEKEIIKL